MNPVEQAIERGLALYLGLVQESSELLAELESSRAEFFASSGPVGPAIDEHAERRHLEWFVLERPSDTLGGVPVEALLPEWTMRGGGGDALPEGALLESKSAAFEVTSNPPDAHGLWVRDLFGMGEYPVDETEAAPELRPGDLLVGRVYPAGGGLFRLSPAMSCFRSPGLVEALREDIERLRASRRGVLRIQQNELERLFFLDKAAAAADAPALDIDGERRRASAELIDAGLAPDLIDDVLQTVGIAARAGRPLVTTLLNELAFDTDVDIERARHALAALWAVECHAFEAPRRDARPGRGLESQDEPGASTEAIRDALAAFDEGKEKGAHLEALFARLEQDLGVDPDGEGESAFETEAGYPGVVGALVEEFLWDVGRQRGNAHADRLTGLRRLSDYAGGIGAFEDLGRREVLDFAGRWLLDEGQLRGPEEARAVLAALEEFCRWSEATQGNPLWTEAGEIVAGLARAVPRLIVARARCAPAAETDTAWSVVRALPEELELESDDGNTRRVRVESSLGQLFRAGDLVHARHEGGRFRLSVAYPAELRELIQAE